MPVKDSRQYRSFELSAGESDGCVVEGYATTFGDAYDMGFGYYERIDPHALDGADMSDVIFQLNHEGMVMARQSNGTLEIEVDQRGLHIRADLSGCQAGRDTVEAIKNKLITKMSWGFMVSEDGWEYDPATRTSTVTKVDKVFDVSAVSIPANPGTEIHTRSYLDGVIEAERRESAQREEQDERERICAALAIY